MLVYHIHVHIIHVCTCTGFYLGGGGGGDQGMFLPQNNNGIITQVLPIFNNTPGIESGGVT